MRIERDIVGRDDYGRLLGYVHRIDDGLFVNLEIVEQGFAQPLTIEPNSAFSQRIRDGGRSTPSTPTVACGPPVPNLADSVAYVASELTLAEQLGYRADDRLVILSCDDLGSCHAANVGVYQRPARRGRHLRIADGARHRGRARRPTTRSTGDDIGVHLTLNAEHGCYRWGPITHAPSLQSG